MNKQQKVPSHGNKNQTLTKIHTSFPQFRKYCQTICSQLNQNQNYFSTYKIINHKLLKQHDAQYLHIQHTSSDPNTQINKLIKINILYSLPYQIPILYFSIYDINTNKPYTVQKIGEIAPKLGAGTVLSGRNVDTGIYISQNPINKQYMYTLHSCELSLEIQYLVPFYFSLLELYPVITY